MTNEEKARIVEDCAVKVGAWSTVGNGSHEERIAMQKTLSQLSHWLMARAAAIRAGSVNGVYE